MYCISICLSICRRIRLQIRHIYCTYMYSYMYVNMHVFDPEPGPEPEPYSDNMSEPEPSSNFPLPQPCFKFLSLSTFSNFAFWTFKKFVRALSTVFQHNCLAKFSALKTTTVDNDLTWYFDIMLFSSDAEFHWRVPGNGGLNHRDTQSCRWPGIPGAGWRF